MSLDLDVIGQSTEPHSFTYDAKTLALYALGIGAKRDELDYLYEGRGPKVYPTFAVVPAMPAVTTCLARTGGDLAMVVHGGQSVTVSRALPSSGTLSTVGVVKAIYDMKKFAQVIIATESRLEGEVVFSSEWNIIFRGAGGFLGPRPPRRDDPTCPKDRPADLRVEEATTPEQALLYRLSGDLNPLHADPEFATAVGFPQGPILHGLCTYGFAARALIRELGTDAERLSHMAAQFRKPVWPGDTLVTQGFRLDGETIAFDTSVKERGETVMNGYCRLR